MPSLKPPQEEAPMSLSMHQVSIPVFQRGLETLAALLRKGEAYAQVAGTDPAALIGARLAPDLLPLSGQVQRASDTGKLDDARLTVSDAPRVADEEGTFPELQDRVSRTAAYLGSFDAGRFEDSETREITILPGNTARSFT